MTVLIRIFCNACHGMAGVGLDFSHAKFNVRETGGRIFGSRVAVCSGCAKATA